MAKSYNISFSKKWTKKLKSKSSILKTHLGTITRLTSRKKSKVGYSKLSDLSLQELNINKPVAKHTNKNFLEIYSDRPLSFGDANTHTPWSKFSWLLNKRHAALLINKEIKKHSRFIRRRNYKKKIKIRYKQVFWKTKRYFRRKRVRILKKRAWKMRRRFKRGKVWINYSSTIKHNSSAKHRFKKFQLLKNRRFSYNYYRDAAWFLKIWQNSLSRAVFWHKLNKNTLDITPSFQKFTPISTGTFFRFAEQHRHVLFFRRRITFNQYSHRTWAFTAYKYQKAFIKGWKINNRIKRFRGWRASKPIKRFRGRKINKQIIHFRGLQRIAGRGMRLDAQVKYALYYRWRRPNIKNSNLRYRFLRIQKYIGKSRHHYKFMSLLRTINPYLWFAIPAKERGLGLIRKLNAAHIAKLLSYLKPDYISKCPKSQRKRIFKSTSIRRIIDALSFRTWLWKFTKPRERNIMRKRNNIAFLTKLIYNYYKLLRKCSRIQRRAIMNSTKFADCKQILIDLKKDKQQRLTKKRQWRKLTKVKLQQYRSFSNDIKVPNLHLQNIASKYLSKSATIYLSNIYVNQINKYMQYFSRKLIKKSLQPIINYKRRIKKSKALYKKIARPYLINIVQNKYGWYRNYLFYRSKWFRKRLKRWLGRFRKIKKHHMFSFLLRNNFKALTGHNERNLLGLWSKFRRSSNKYWGPISLVQKFAGSLLLTPINLLMLLRMAPSNAAATSLINSGNVIINGLHIVEVNVVLKPGDILQINKQFTKINKILFSYHQWKIPSITNSFSFIEMDIAMGMFIVISLPKLYELLAPTYLSERWIRYYIRHFPLKIKKYSKAKQIWVPNK